MARRVREEELVYSMEGITTTIAVEPHASVCKMLVSVLNVGSFDLGDHRVHSGRQDRRAREEQLSVPRRRDVDAAITARAAA